MARYDRNYQLGMGARRPRIWGRGDAEIPHTDFDALGGEVWPRGGWGGSYGGAGRFSGTGTRRHWEPGEGDYARGVYGGDYPGFGGYPGAGREGTEYGGRGGGGMQRPNVGRRWYPQRYDAEYQGGYTRGYDRGPISERVQRHRGYGGDFAREPFMPEAAYLRHPEYETPSTYHQNRWERPGEYVVPREERLSDDEIRREVQQRLHQDSWLRADEIDVDVEQGVVTLRGEVNDFLEARYAWDDAWETDGVRGVVNNLTVRPEGGEGHGDEFNQSA
ncbi:MAG TPA: BON domain-containing protein [Longimicrobiaceae bacterium]|nr:BON domain-containing protein [Longimicrobiaceae bacterium]